MGCDQDALFHPAPLAGAGSENNNFGTSDWTAVAGYVRVKLSGKFFLAARADVFWEHVASSPAGTASALFWPGDRVASQTVTLDFRPLDNISVRLEGRHDSGSTTMYFRGKVSGDGSTSRLPYVPNARSQRHDHPRSNQLVLANQTERVLISIPPLW